MDPADSAYIRGEAVVVAAGDGRLEVEARPRSACGGCAQAGGCGVSVVSGLLSRKSARLVLSDTCGARVGETLILGIPRASLLKASLVAYLLPVAGLVAGAMIGIGFGGGDGIALLAALAGLAAGLLAARRLGNSAGGLKPVILGRSGATASPSCDLP